MKIVNVQQNTREWFLAKRGKISGSSLGKVYQEKGFLKGDLIEKLTEHGIEFNPKDTIPKLMEHVTPEIRFELFREIEQKRAFWQILSERLFPPKTEQEEEEDARNRGHRLEQAACDEFEKETGKTVRRDVGMIVSDENDNMSVSPDGTIWDDKTIVEAVEAKNFEDAHHVEAVVTQKVPKELWPQVIQYFIVIDTLKELHLIFHTDRAVHPRLKYFRITIKREDIQYEIEKYKTYELNALRLMDEIVEEYAF